MVSRGEGAGSRQDYRSHGIRRASELHIPQCAAVAGLSPAVAGGGSRRGWFLFKLRQGGKWRRGAECGGLREKETLASSGSLPW